MADNPNSFSPKAPLRTCLEGTAGATVAAGDLLAWSSGTLIPYAEGTHTEAVGVAVHAASSGGDLLYWGDPDQIFVVQTSGSYVDASEKGSTCDIEGTTGIQEANEDANTNGTLRIIGREDGEETTETNARIIVKINKHVAAPTPGTLKPYVMVASGNFSPGKPDVATLSAARTLTATHAFMQILDPGGAHRDVTLPADASSTNLMFWIVNAADAAENLVVKNAAASTVVTVNQNEEAIVYYNGTAWALARVATIALS